MKKNITKSELRDYIERWKMVNAFELREIRNATPMQKFRQLASLMSSAFLFGAHAPKLKEIRVVQRRWQLLRKGWRRAAQ